APRGVGRGASLAPRHARLVGPGAPLQRGDPLLLAMERGGYCAWARGARRSGALRIAPSAGCPVPERLAWFAETPRSRGSRSVARHEVRFLLASSLRRCDEGRAMRKFSRPPTSFVHDARVDAFASDGTSL